MPFLSGTHNDLHFVAGLLSGFGIRFTIRGGPTRLLGNDSRWGFHVHTKRQAVLDLQLLDPAVP